MVVINMQEVFDFFVGIFEKFKDLLYSVLPTSPLRQYISKFQNAIPEKYIQYLNWFVPVSEILGVFAAFLTVLVLYYMYSVIMRWIKLIG